MRIEKACFPADSEPNKLLKVTTSLILNVENIASMLENKYEESLLPPLSGLYREGAAYPIKFEEIQNLLQTSKNKPYVMSFADDLHRRLQLNDLDAKINKKEILYDSPTVKARGLRLVELVDKNEISLQSQYLTDASLPVSICRMFKEDTVFSNGKDIMECDDAIMNQCKSIRDNVSDFIGEDTFHIYRVYTKRYELYIEKLIDWRIYDWHLQRYMKFEQEKDECY